MEESCGFGREKQVVDLGKARMAIALGNSPADREREAGSGSEMAIALWKSPADLGREKQVVD